MMIENEIMSSYDLNGPTKYYQINFFLLEKNLFPSRRHIKIADAIYSNQSFNAPNRFKLKSFEEIL